MDLAPRSSDKGAIRGVVESMRVRWAWSMGRGVPFPFGMGIRRRQFRLTAAKGQGRSQNFCPGMLTFPKCPPLLFPSSPLLPSSLPSPFLPPRSPLPLPVPGLCSLPFTTTFSSHIQSHFPAVSGAQTHFEFLTHFLLSKHFSIVGTSFASTFHGGRQQFYAMHARVIARDVRCKRVL